MVMPPRDVDWEKGCSVIQVTKLDGRSHLFHRDYVVKDLTARRARDNDATARSVDDPVIVDQAIGTTEADTVSPLLESIRAARTDIVADQAHVRTGEWTSTDVKTRPRARVI